MQENVINKEDEENLSSAVEGTSSKNIIQKNQRSKCNIIKTRRSKRMKKPNTRL